MYAAMCRPRWCVDGAARGGLSTGCQLMCCCGVLRLSTTGGCWSLEMAYGEPGGTAVRVLACRVGTSTSVGLIGSRDVWCERCGRWLGW